MALRRRVAKRRARKGRGQAPESSDARRFRAIKALDALKILHAHTQRPGRDPETHEDATEDPFQVLISTVLSQRTRDEMTAVAALALFAEFPDPPALARAPLPRVRKLIRPVGFYNEKSKRIREIARVVEERFGGRVPADIDALLTLPGVGRKTANCVLVFGFGVPAIPVDTHVHRISNRLGIVRTKHPEETERELASLLPRDRWLEVNELLVTHGREVCRPIGPRCEACPIEACPSRRRPRAVR
jgi:endonuclease-3